MQPKRGRNKRLNTYTKTFDRYKEKEIKFREYRKIFETNPIMNHRKYK